VNLAVIRMVYKFRSTELPFTFFLNYRTLLYVQLL